MEQPAGTVDQATAVDSAATPLDLSRDAPLLPDSMAADPSRATSSSGAIRVDPTSLSGGQAALERPEGLPTMEPDIPAAIVSAAATPRSSTGTAEVDATPLRAPEPVLISTAVYFAGSPRLEIGARYGLVIEGSRFKIVGPYDPSVVAFERPIAGLAATVNLGRVLLAFPDGRGSIAIVFTALAGATPQQVVETLLKAAERASE